MRQYRVIQFGFGSLGMEIFRVLRARRNFELVGIIDVDETKVGNDAGILAFNKRVGMKIVNNIDSIRSKPDVAIHATTSSLSEAYSQICSIVKHRINVISTCEQLVYPHGINKNLARKLDTFAQKHKVRVLGVGVNPGFVMDSLVLMLTSLCSKIERIRIERVVDVTKRRKALQEKMCMGLTLEQFEEIRRVKGSVGHVGLAESATMICDALNTKGAMSTMIRPVIANRMIHAYNATIEPGKVAGIEHRLVVKRKETKFLEIVLYMFAGASEFDLIEIEGTPPISMRTNGIAGDQATIALLLNYVPIVLKAKAGLHTVNRLPIPSINL
ncbi:MAG: hypothetical protein QXU32_05340 [Nitrososphaerales archaeon]